MAGDFAPLDRPERAFDKASESGVCRANIAQQHGFSRCGHRFPVRFNVPLYYNGPGWLRHQPRGWNSRGAHRERHLGSEPTRSWWRAPRGRARLSATTTGTYGLHQHHWQMAIGAAWAPSYERPAWGLKAG